MKEDEILFFHGRTVDGARFTMAGKYSYHKDVEDADLITSVAVCSENDQFVKRVGVMKSTGRILSKNFRGCDLVNMYSPKNFHPDKPLASFTAGWFRGKEVNVFVEYAKRFEKMTKRELLEKYNLR